MLKTGVYFAGRMLVVVIMCFGFSLPLLVYAALPGVQHQVPALYGVLVLALLAGMIVYELGRLVACWAVGAEVKAFRLGGKRAPVRFRIGTVEVSLGLPYQGQVEYDGAFSLWRRGVILLAGPFADLAAAGLVLAGAAAADSGQLISPSAVVAADGLAVLGLVALIPWRAWSGELSDGARLCELRSGIASERLVAARRTAARLLRAGRTAELLELHAGLPVPGGMLSALQAANLALVELYVALLPEELPDAAAQLAERRALALTRQEAPRPVAPGARVTLALLRLRRGDAQGHAEAGQLCEQVLAGEDADDATRLIALAAVVVSRRARGLPDADVRAAAAAMPGQASRSVELMAAEYSAAFVPETVLRAFRDGDPGARLGAGRLARLLRRQGRTGELLELHAGFGAPAGAHALEQARSLASVEYNVLLLPDLPPAVLGEAASRVEQIAASFGHEQQDDPVHHAALEHILAVARLRQGRFAEVEPLCAPGIAADIGPDARATVLATIALARCALGQPHAGPLAEAIGLSPDADLVAEARQSQPRPAGMT